MELLYSQPLPPQLQPRQSQALKSPSAGTGSKGPGEPYLEMKQTDVEGFLHANCTRISKEEGSFSFQADIELNPETTETIIVQVTARQDFARLPMSRQQRGMIASSTEQIKQFDPDG